MAALSSLVCAPAQAVTVINFDSLPGMPNNPGTIIPTANRLSNQLLSTTGARFASAVGYVAVVNLSLRPGETTTSMPNVIGGVNSAGNLSYGTPVWITFFDPANSLVPAITDFVQIRGDTLPLSGATATVDGFDIRGQLIGSVTASDTAGGLTLTLAVPNIHSVRVSQNSAGFGFDGTIGLDDLAFNPVQPVPEPSTAFFLLTGLVLCLTPRSLRGNEQNN